MSYLYICTVCLWLVFLHLSVCHEKKNGWCQKDLHPEKPNDIINHKEHDIFGGLDSGNRDLVLHVPRMLAPFIFGILAFQRFYLFCSRSAPVEVLSAQSPRDAPCPNLYGLSEDFDPIDIIDSTMNPDPFSTLRLKECSLKWTYVNKDFTHKTFKSF